MFKFVVLACVFVSGGICAPTDYDDLNLPNLGIVGGDITYIDNHPYQVSLQYNHKHFCGGAIVNENTIITAAHCTQNPRLDRLTIRAGTNGPVHGGSVVKVKSIQNHPLYSTENHTHDISIIFLAENLKLGPRIQKIALADTNEKTSFEGETAIVTGWGHTKEKGSISNLLQKVSVSILTASKCKASYPNKITDSMICAGEEGKDACQADSGGPLACNGKLCGVVSWGIGCGRAGNPGVYTNVAVERSWIDEMIKKSSQS